MSIYTKAGDKGITMLQDGKPIPKHHPIIQALAALDELNAHLGVVKSRCTDAEPVGDFERIQKNIMAMMSLISTTTDGKPPTHMAGSIVADTGSDEIFADEVAVLESKIDAINSQLPSMTSFVTYGACPKSAALDLARAVTRRAETLLSQAAEFSMYARAAFAYINRLSDFLYVMARYADFEYTVTWVVEEVLCDMGDHPIPLQNCIDTHLQGHDQPGAIPTLGLSLTLSEAKTLLEKIERKANEINLPIVAACASAAGHPIAVHGMDGALLVSYEAAVAKAYTAAAVRMPTTELHKLVQPGQPFYGLESLGNGKILPIGGGVPLFGPQGRLIGAIGVSGGTAEQDHELANAALQ